MERRNFLKAAVIAASTPAAAWAPSRGISLETLIEDHTAATQLDHQAWGRVVDIEESDAMEARPIAQVAITRPHPSYDLQFAKSIDEIEASAARDLNIRLSICGDNEPARQRATDEIDRLVADRAGRLAELQSERRAIEDECGFTEALASAEAAADRVRATEQSILDYVPVSLEEAARQARWVLDGLRRGHGYLCDRENASAEALATLARAFHQ
jgi:hypothetical protein